MVVNLRMIVGLVVMLVRLLDRCRMRAGRWWVSSRQAWIHTSWRCCSSCPMGNLGRLDLCHIGRWWIGLRENHHWMSVSESFSTVKLSECLDSQLSKRSGRSKEDLEMRTCQDRN